MSAKHLFKASRSHTAVINKSMNIIVYLSPCTDCFDGLSLPNDNNLWHSPHFALHGGREPEGGAINTSRLQQQRDHPLTSSETLPWPCCHPLLRIPYARRCKQLTFTGSSAGTRPSARTATAPTRRSSIWCSSVRPMITPGGTPGQETPSQPTRDASGATWNGLGR